MVDKPGSRLVKAVASLFVDLIVQKVRDMGLVVGRWLIMSAPTRAIGAVKSRPVSGPVYQVKSRGRY